MCTPTLSRDAGAEVLRTPALSKQGVARSGVHTNTLERCRRRSVAHTNTFENEVLCTPSLSREAYAEVLRTPQMSDLNIMSDLAVPSGMADLTFECLT